MQLPVRYVWAVWAGASWLPWLCFYALFPNMRSAMRWASLFALPFGFSEFLFFRVYWKPPTLFSLAGRTRLDVESFFFLFAVGGIAAVLYNVFSRKPIVVMGREKDPSRQQWYEIGLAVPAFVFPITLICSNRPLVAGVAAMLFGAGVRGILRPDLISKMFLGGFLFFIYYVLLLELLVWFKPGFIAKFWIPTASLGIVVNIPTAELLFGASFGLYWSGLYEHYHWTFAR